MYSYQASTQVVVMVYMIRNSLIDNRTLWTKEFSFTILAGKRPKNCIYIIHLCINFCCHMESTSPFDTVMVNDSDS